ncbi:IS607 family transposase [Saccharopolyspora hattusasensis]|uniref:IS607 family transposase n=1 Tax=Saccharopolyspora hattusasensis TaxID=1128679 RepID=UPI003D97A73D
MRLSEWAEREGVHYQTAWAWAKSGRMPVPVVQTPSGTWLVREHDRPAGFTVAYCRVSSADQEDDLERQAGRVVAACGEQGISIDRTVTEVGSGLNGNRPKLRKLFVDPRVSTIVVEHRDRLARFGVEHLESALAATGRRIVVLNPEEVKDDLVRDMVDVLTSMCARLYGRGSARKRAEAGVACATAEVTGL